MQRGSPQSCLNHRFSACLNERIFFFDWSKNSWEPNFKCRCIFSPKLHQRSLFCDKQVVFMKTGGWKKLNLVLNTQWIILSGVLSVWYVKSMKRSNTLRAWYRGWTSKPKKSWTNRKAACCENKVLLLDPIILLFVLRFDGWNGSTRNISWTSPRWHNDKLCCVLSKKAFPVLRDPATIDLLVKLMFRIAETHSPGLYFRSKKKTRNVDLGWLRLFLKPFNKGLARIYARNWNIWATKCPQTSNFLR